MIIRKYRIQRENRCRSYEDKKTIGETVFAVALQPYEDKIIYIVLSEKIHTKFYLNRKFESIYNSCNELIALRA